MLYLFVCSYLFWDFVYYIVILEIYNSVLETYCNGFILKQ